MIDSKDLRKETSKEEEKFITAADKAYHIITKNILNGKYKPGDKLSRRKMAAETGVSVIPVIEALNRLSEDGLVESKPKWGSCVTIPTQEKIMDAFVLREAIECEVACILARNITEEQALELRKMASRLDIIKYNQENLDDFDELHYALHMHMAELTGYHSLISTLRRINLFLVLYRAAAIRRPKNVLPKDWHLRLINAIASRNENAAEDAMRTHVRDSLQ